MLSIVIPTKNEAETLPPLFASLRKQTFRDFEVIVANGPSTDQTEEVAKENGATVVKGGMPGEGRNLGARAAKGDVLLFLDADVEFPNDRFLEDAMKEFEERHLDTAAPDIAWISKNLVYRASYNAYNKYARITQSFWPHAPGFCMFVRREVHETIKGFDETVVFAEDHEYVQRAHKLGFKFGILAKSKAIRTSVRRFERDGWIKTIAIYIYTDLRMKIFGPYRYEIPFSYEMGGDPHHSKENKES